jgi:ubiquinone/menaquinone biosynthesis C-methylase UbiE
MMFKRTDFKESDVQGFYSGPAGSLWELCMTEEIHSGGKETTNVMAKALGLKPGMHVLDVCSALGAPARHIVKDHGVQVTGLDFTDAYNEEANKRTKAAGLDKSILFVRGNAMDMPFPAETFDVVWGQEAWCHVLDKDKLIAEAFRVLKPGGKLGFTDWIVTGQIADAELKPLMEMMAFPNMQSFTGWQEAMKKVGFKVLDAKDETEAYARCWDDYVRTVTKDAKEGIIKANGPDIYAFAEKLVTDWSAAAHAHKVGRGFYIAQK